MAGSPSSTAVLASGYCAPSMMLAHFTRSSRSGAVKSHLSRAIVADIAGAGLDSWDRTSSAASVVPEVLGVLGRQEGALMMIEPPGQARIVGVLEIDDGVLVAVEQAVFEELRRLVGHAGVWNSASGWNVPADEAAEEGRRGRAVETMVVIEDSHPHSIEERVKTFHRA